MKMYVTSASTLEDAILKGLQVMGLRRDQVDVEILEEKTSTLISMMDHHYVRICLREKAGKASAQEKVSPRGDGPPGSETRAGGSGRPPEGRRGDRRMRDKRPPRQENREQRPFRGPPERPAQQPKPVPAVERGNPPARREPGNGHNRQPEPVKIELIPLIEKILSDWKPLMGMEDFSWEIKREQGKEPSVILKMSQGSLLYGTGGEVLESFQYLFNLALIRHSKDRPRIEFKIDGLGEPGVDRIAEEAQNAARQVVETGQVYRLDPMKSSERRVVHQTLANHPEVETVSEGDGPWRKVVVRPKVKQEPRT